MAAINIFKRKHLKVRGQFKISVFQISKLEKIFNLFLLPGDNRPRNNSKPTGNLIRLPKTY